jgi:subtilisin-like proprotein convertase family protein
MPRDETTLTRSSGGATGLSVDAVGKIWAGCFDANAAVRIDPNAGPMVLTTNVVPGTTDTVTVTNHVGLVDMVVDLGNGTWHSWPYNVAARPYNYSDMTGFNVRVVNPGSVPLKGYWMVVNDSGYTAQLWNRVSWTAETNGGSIEVYVRASDDRAALGSEPFLAVTNNVSFPPLRGRYLEVRLGMTRDDPSKQPVLYDLTLYGMSSSFAGDFLLYDQWADEGSNAVFFVNLTGPAPMSYQWFVQYPWMTNMVMVSGTTNSTFTISNVDSWVGAHLDANGILRETMVSVLVTSGSGETLWLGPAFLEVVPLLIHIPATNYANGPGPAERYPATINAFGQPTNFSQLSVTVTLWDLSHTRSADLWILLVSPSNKGIMLMSSVGGPNAVSHTILSFRQSATQPPQPKPIPSGGPWPFGPSNYGQVSQMPRVGVDPPPIQNGSYSISLDDLKNDDPNGTWKLYIYDIYEPGGIGQLSDSWELDFDFQ